MAVFTLGEMLALPMASAYVADLAPPHMRGRYMGVNGMTWALALIVGPVVGMKLFALHPAAYWVACATLGVLAAVIIFSANTTPIAQAGLAGQRRRPLPCDNQPAG